jgi:lipopolysaccharide/colanic/teichoic acid biosynthesis glycosyltransferase
VKIVVTGADGFVAGQLVSLLVEAGHSLLLVSRNPGPLQEGLPRSESVSNADWASRASSYDAVLHLAFQDSGGGSSASFTEVNDGLSGDLAAKARDLGIKRFIFASSVHTLDPLDNSFSAQNLRAGEESVRHSFGESCEVVYLGAVYGSRFAGKMAILNNLPPFIRRPGFQALSALNPVTNVRTISNYVGSGPAETADRVTILADNKDDSPVYRLWRRTLDLVFVTGALLVSPLIALVWLAIVKKDGSPGFFVQHRIGAGGKVFPCIKLRTMANGTVSKGTHLVDGSAVTKVGGFLRRFKIDEIPQAINVAKAEMNLIGPRPSLADQHEVIESRRSLGVLRSTPGLTGWAQVNGIDMSAPAELAKLDAQYLKLRSILWDIKIMKRTLRSRSSSQRDGAQTEDSRE